MRAGVSQLDGASMNWDPPVSPAAPTEPVRERSYRTFWVAGAVVVGALVILPTVGALSGDDDPATAPTATVRSPPRGDQANQAAVPALQASGCPSVDVTVVDDVNARLDPGLTLGLAASASSDGIIWLLGSIYRQSDGERVSSADTWARVDGQIYAVSGSAREFSNLPNGRQVVPEAFSNSTRSDLETCVTNAIINGSAPAGT